MYAVKDGHTEIVSLFLSHAGSEDKPVLLSTCNNVRLFALCVFINNYLLEFGLQKGQNGVLIACQYGQLECLKLLDEHISADTSVWSTASKVSFV